MPRTSAPPDPNRQLMIKTKACQRLIKEVAHYHREAADNDAKLMQMKADGKDEYDIKLFSQVVDESYVMIPDSERRLAQALDDLHECLENDEVDKEGEWCSTAMALLEKKGKGDTKQMEGEENATETCLDDLKEGEDF